MKTNVYLLLILSAAMMAVILSFEANAQCNLTVTCTGVNPSKCNNICDGSATVNPSGGTAPYRFFWSNGQTTSTIKNLCASSSGFVYLVTVTDANNCKVSCSTALTQPSQLTLSCSGSNVTCNGGNNGRASVIASGGTPPYSYQWSDSASTASRSGLRAGTYCVLVFDAKGCTSSCCVTITQPSALVAACSGTSVTCNGGNNGTASVVVSGGTAPYSFLWTDSATTASRSGLRAGTYCVFVFDANGCTGSCCFTVAQPAPFTGSCSATPLTCNGGNDGTACLQVTGGTPPYTYLWSNGGTTSCIRNLAAGSYSVTLTDARGCASSCGPIGVSAALVATCSGTNVSCNGGNNGRASVIASGGTPPYSYQWSDSASTASRSGLRAGTYCVLVFDAKGCTSSCCVTITQPSALVAACSGTSVTCNGGNNGTASVVVSGGTAPYSFLWTDSATTASRSGLRAGTYCVFVFDANGCTGSCCFTIAQPAPFTGSCSATPLTCNGGNDGTACLQVTGGTPPYTYLWSNGGTTSCIRNLAAGSYSVTLTDARGCASSCGPIGVSAALVATCSGTNVSCNGGNNGRASVIASGGTAPYTFLWSPGGATTSSVSGLRAGTYCVVVTNFNACTSSCCVTINEPSALTVNCTGVSPTCNGTDDGSACVSAGGGIMPYTYRWSNGGTTACISGLTGSSAGTTYCVTLIDNNGCTISCCAALSQPSTCQIITGAIAGSPFCPNASVSIPFSSSLSFNHGNVFTAQLSDANGSFGSATAIGSLSSFKNFGTIAAIIPGNATAGTHYRIRVISSDPVATGSNNGTDLTVNSCNTASIITGTIAGGPFCTSATVNVPFTSTATFNFKNVFTAELSDTAGGFFAPVTIGTLKSTTPGTITAMIPSNAFAGTRYRIRVISSNPGITGSDNGINLAVISGAIGATGPVSGPTTVCLTIPAHYSIAAVTGATNYTWSISGKTSISLGQGTNAVTVAFTNNFRSGTLLVTPNNVCTTGGSSSLIIDRGTCRTMAETADVESNKSATLSIFPNPALQQISINAEGYEGLLQLQIVNVLGEQLITKSIELKAEETYSIDISSLASGIYKVILVNDKVVNTGTFVKE